MKIREKIKAEIYPFLPLWIIEGVENYGDMDNLREIRLRTGAPVAFVNEAGIEFLNGKSGVSKSLSSSAPSLSSYELWDIFKKLCAFSFHTYENKIKQGYLTINGGHRIGVSGDFTEDTNSFGVKNITSINIRIAREIMGCADEIIKSALANTQKGVLILSPPACGKTTMLRDIAHAMSEGRFGGHFNVSLIDERGELSGYMNGASVFSVGCCTDIIFGCDKAQGIMRAIRTLSPDVIVCDEAGSSEEVRAISEGFNAGACVITSAHAFSEEDIYKRPTIKALLETGAFKYAVMLQKADKPGQIKWIKEVKMCAETNDYGVNFHLCDYDRAIKSAELIYESEELRDEYTGAYIAF